MTGQVVADGETVAGAALRQVEVMPGRTNFTFIDPAFRHQVDVRLASSGQWEVVPLPVLPFEELRSELRLRELRVGPLAAFRIVDEQFGGCDAPVGTLRARLVWAVYCRRRKDGVITGATVDGRTGAFHTPVPQPAQLLPASTAAAHAVPPSPTVTTQPAASP